ncbi:MAG: hypothetical protein HYY17_15040 [Planctomycetes bacterium]|nr:hypothetical protein [Planctomycetota bacterium]
MREAEVDAEVRRYCSKSFQRLCRRRDKERERLSRRLHANLRRGPATFRENLSLIERTVKGHVAFVARVLRDMENTERRPLRVARA